MEALPKDPFSPWPLASDAELDSFQQSPGFAEILRAEEETWRCHWTEKSLLVKGNRSIPRFRWMEGRIYYPEYAEKDEIGDLFSDEESTEKHNTEARGKHASWLASLLLRLHEDVVLMYYTCQLGAATCHVIHPSKGILESCAMKLDLQLLQQLCRGQSRRLLRKSQKAEFCRWSIQVAEMLLEPVSAHVEKASWLHFVAEGEIQQLQFHALPWQGAPLITAKLVSYANSLTEMALQASCRKKMNLMAETPESTRSVACVLSGPSKSRQRKVPRKAAAPWKAEGEELEDLNAAVCEGNVVQDTLVKKYVVYMLQGAELGYEQVCGLRDVLDVHQKDLHASILHVSAHFRLPEGVEEDSYLALSFGNNLPSRHLPDAIPDFLDLCLLSVCCSGKLVPGKNELVSLLAGKGCRFSITTEWEIDDPAALVYANSFYRHLDCDVFKVLQAHQEAQKELLSTAVQDICEQARVLISKYQCSPAVDPLKGGQTPARCTTRGAGQLVEMDAQASAMLSSIETTLCSLKLDDANVIAGQDESTEERKIQEFINSFQSLPYWWASHRVYCNVFQDIKAESDEEEDIEMEDGTTSSDETPDVDESKPLPTLLVPRLVPHESHVDCLVGLSDSGVLCFSTEGKDTCVRRCRFQEDALEVLETRELSGLVVSVIFCESSNSLVVACNAHCFCCEVEDLQPKWIKPNLFLQMAQLPGTSTVFAVEGLLGVDGKVISGIKLQAFDILSGAACEGFRDLQEHFPSAAPGVPSGICFLHGEVGGNRLIATGSAVFGEPELLGIDVASGKEVWRRPCPADESGRSDPALCSLDENEGLLGSYFFILRFNASGEYLQQFNCTNSCRQLEFMRKSDGIKLLLLGHRQVFVVDWSVAQEQHQRAFKNPKDSINFHFKQVLDADETGHRFEKRLWQYMGQEDLLSNPSDSDSIESSGSDSESRVFSPETAEQTQERNEFLKRQHEDVMKRHSQTQRNFTEMQKGKRKMDST